MGKTFGKFKLNIGDPVSSYGRDLIIIDREYRQKQRKKNGKQFTANTKWYKYHCNKCGNEDWIIEHSVLSNNPSGCNACCVPPKKAVKGINDVSTTASWMLDLFVDKNDAYKNHKYSNNYVNMICPHCGRTQRKQILQVMSAHGLSCVCGDGRSYPNKFVYSLLDQAEIDYETEKSFRWSDKRFYDIYFEYKGISYIIEQNGRQHYDRSIIKGKRNRSLEEEIINDKHKYDLAIMNGIDRYYSIDCSISSPEYIKRHIIDSGLLKDLGVSESSIDWARCDEFATKNLVKDVCVYKSMHEESTLDEIARLYHIHRTTALHYIQKGVGFGWCIYSKNEDRKKKDKKRVIDHGAKPVYCITTNQLFDSANVAAKYFQTDEDKWNGRAIRKSIERNQSYKKHKFKYVS